MTAADNSPENGRRRIVAAEAAHRRWLQTGEAARRYLTAAFANGAGSFPAHMYQRATETGPAVAAARAAALARLGLATSPACTRRHENDGCSTISPAADLTGDPIMSDSLLEYKLDLIARQLNAYVIEDVATVMRRQFTREDGADVTVIDFYPPWNASGTFGKHKIAHEYLDESWQIERFEKYAGVTVAELPIYEASQALKRNAARPHACEVTVRPFRLMLQPRQDAEGNDLKTLILRYLTSPEARRRPTRETAVYRPEDDVTLQPRPRTGPGQVSVVGAPTQPEPPKPAAGIDHLSLAIEAASDTAFDYHAYMHFRNGTITEVKNITWLRRQISERWQPDGGEGNGRLLAAIDTYLKKRREAEQAGEPQSQHHKLAIGPARRAYQLQEVAA